MGMMLENIGLAFSSLKSNKMRALLTMLGIIIGIMSIIGIMIIGDAMTASVSGELSNLGTNNITLNVQEKGSTANAIAVRMGGGGNRQKQPSSDDLITDQVLEEIRREFENDIIGISVSYSAGQGKAQDGELYANVSISGVNKDYLAANNLTLLEGTFLTEEDIASHAQSAVVSDKFIANLFSPSDHPVGNTVKIYKAKSVEIYTIIGIYQYEQMGFGGTASDQDITTSFYIPVTTAKQDVIEKNYSNVTVVGKASSDVNELTNKIQRFCNSIYAGSDEWQLTASNMSSMLDTVQSMMKTISIAIAFIAGISLLVGGIGVMNIMLVSVTERTREIGTRKALGAQNFHIQLQFVTEAMIVSAVGGVIGLLLGIAVGSVATKIFSVPLVVSPATTIGSVLFSMAIGVIFGLYPARKAAKMDPIDALRYE